MEKNMNLIHKNIRYAILVQWTYGHKSSQKVTA